MTRSVSLLSAALVAVAVAAAPTPSTAAPRNAFDGAWSVLIVTEQGSCERAYRTSVNIVNGTVVGGSSIAAVSGRVAPSGSVAVRVSSGSSYANGNGRLGRASGGGAWRGAGSTGQCTGRWSAQRY